MSFRTAAALVLGIAYGAGPGGQALAQTPPADAIPEKVAPGPALGADPKSKNDLSGKLDLSNGVIHPDPSIDPSIQKLAPKTGATPVIPPSQIAPGAQPK